MFVFGFEIEPISSPTWLSSFSAAILMLGSIVPLRACIIRLGSMCVHGFLFSRFSLSHKYPLSLLLFCYRFTQTLWTLHFGSDPQTRLPVSTLKCLWKGSIAECCNDHRFFLLKCADLRRNGGKDSKTERKTKYIYDFNLLLCGNKSKRYFYCPLEAWRHCNCCAWFSPVV